MVNVLIVEDDLPIAYLLQEALEVDGYHVCEIARTWDEAMDAAERHAPDYAIVDVHLADGSLGTDFVTVLRENQTVVVMFSTGSDDVSTFVAHEGDAVMTKPYLMRDAVRGLKIVDEIAQHGTTQLAFPSSFRLIG
jgi:DNA-binding response OmpR family regulator